MYVCIQITHTAKVSMFHFGKVYDVCLWMYVYAKDACEKCGGFKTGNVVAAVVYRIWNGLAVVMGG